MAEQDKDLEGFFDGDDAELEAMESMAEDFADESGDIEEPEAVKESPSPSNAVAKSQSSTPALNGLDFDFASLGSLPGVVVGNTGLEVSRFPVERLKFQEGQRTLISILSDKVIAVKVHYDEDGLGSFLCFNGACCEHGDLPRVKYVYPVVKYDTNSKGKPISKEVRCYALAIGQEAYETLLTVQELKGNLTQFNFLISCSDATYQKISIQEAGPALYLKYPEMQKPINEFWAQNSKDILKSTARKITPEEYMKAKSVQVSTEQDVDFDSVFGEN